jgi:hypothetical protein
MAPSWPHPERVGLDAWKGKHKTTQHRREGMKKRRGRENRTTEQNKIRNNDNNKTSSSSSEKQSRSKRHKRAYEIDRGVHSIASTPFEISDCHSVKKEFANACCGDGAT